MTAAKTDRETSFCAPCADMRRMKKLRLWRHGVIVLMSCAVVVFGRTDEAGSPTPADDAHANIDCTLCHSLVASLEETVTASSPKQRCLSCHAVPTGNQSGISAAFHEDDNRTCGECHQFHDPGMISAQGNVFAPVQSGGPGSCIACHYGSEKTAFLSEGHRMAADLYHSNLPEMIGLTSSEGCLLCHAEEQSVPIAGLDPTIVPRFASHRMHPIGPIERTGDFRNGARIRQVLDPRLRLYDNRIECHTCHQLTNLDKNRLVDLGSPEALCLGCHEFE